MQNIKLELNLENMSKAEEFIQENTRNCSQLHYNSACTLRHCITPDQARRAVEIAREEICEWLRVNLCDYFDAPREDYDMCINDLKQAMNYE